MKLAQGKGQVLFTKPTRKVDTGVFKVQIPIGEASLPKDSIGAETL